MFSDTKYNTINYTITIVSNTVISNTFSMSQEVK